MKFCIDLSFHDTFREGTSLSDMLNTIQKGSMILHIESFITINETKYVTGRKI